MNTNTQQVFQTASATRWERFKWGGRVLLLLFSLGIAVLVISLWKDTKPEVPQLNESLKKILQPDQPFAENNKLTRDYAGFRQYITAKYDRKRNFYQQSKYSNTNNHPFSADARKGRPFSDFPCGIRAAFYVNWDEGQQSFRSLKNNVSSLNLVIPEWLFLDPVTDTIKVTTDAKGLAVMKASGVKIMPILSNNVNKVFRGDLVKRIINSPEKKERLINNLVTILTANNFYGVNVDFEELDQTTDEPLVAFQKELYEKLHEKGFVVSQDVIPFNDDYNFTELAKYNDYIFLMAYDQYNDATGPGPISSQKWIEAALDAAAKNIPSEKIILCMAAYGYDWSVDKTDTTQTVSFQNALKIARESEGKIDFDNNTYNLNYNYYDDKDTLHHVYFTDAATNFNTLRFASEYNISGVALWRLGTEDNRLWHFYDKDMTREALAQFDFNEFAKAGPTSEPDYIGDGEILDVVGLPKSGIIRPQVDSAEILISEENYDSLPAPYVIRKYGQPKGKQVVLSFDDGPDPKYTPQILDILGKEKVPASFFVVGINAENNIPLLKRIYNEGYEIGNHTFTHPNIAAVSTQRANIEMESTRLLIEAVTGHSTILFRAPFNADYEPGATEELIPVALARKKNYLDIGESIDPEDWEIGVSADTIVARVIAIKKRLDANDINGGIILLHDAGGDTRKATVQALPRIIKYFKDNGYQFTTIADLLHKKRDDLMPPVPKGNGYYLVQLNYFLAEFGYWGGHILSSLFIVFIVLSLSRILLMGILAAVQHRKEKKENIVPSWASNPNAAPLVSIIVPAYNEEVNAVGSLNNLLKTDYPRFEIIFVDDGSKDSTYEKVSAAFKDHPSVRVLTKPNGGKASALNYGILQSGADYVICIDADTKLLPNAVSLLMRHFDELSNQKNTTGAVAGNVKVGNEVNAITRWQAIEYITSQNFDRKAFAAINSITVVPGAIGAFRKKALEEAGGFTTDTLAEDCDLTIRILRCGYTIKNDNKAIAMTEAPETVKMFLKQRFRWSFGVMQTFWKNRDALFNWKYKWLGWIALPNILIFQFIIPTIAPLADLFMIIGLITGNSEKILLYYFVFMLVDAAVSVLAFSYEKEKISKLIWLIPQRFVYRWLMYYVLFKSFRKAIKGELQHWGVLKRTGNVKDIEPAV